jgi:hypothetical protein
MYLSGRKHTTINQTCLPKNAQVANRLARMMASCLPPATSDDEPEGLAGLLANEGSSSSIGCFPSSIALNFPPSFPDTVEFPFSV